jgi:hypothetical protein
LILVELWMEIKGFAGVDGGYRHVVGAMAAENEKEKSWGQGKWVLPLRSTVSVIVGGFGAVEVVLLIKPWELHDPRQVVKPLVRGQLSAKSNLLHLV